MQVFGALQEMYDVGLLKISTFCKFSKFPRLYQIIAPANFHTFIAFVYDLLIFYEYLEGLKKHYFCRKLRKFLNLLRCYIRQHILL